jgi:plastocyanin
MRSRRLPLVLAAGFTLWSNHLCGQSVEGRVDLPKPLPDRGQDQRYQSSGEAPAAPELPTAVVYLEGIFPKSASAPSHVAEMAQKNISFGPSLLPIQVGTTVEFPNLDDTYHNVFSYSKTKRFDLGRYRKEEKPGTVVFDKPGVVTLHCEVHGTMRGTILVLDTPYFQKTDTKGAFRFGHLPAGHYLLKAWIGEGDVRSQTVELKAGETLHVDFAAK